MPTSSSPTDRDRLRALPNPFESTVLHRAGEETFRHVPDIYSIHAGTQQLILQLLNEVRTTGQQRSLFVWGEAGSGKTHLIARLLHIWRDLPGSTAAVYIHMSDAVREHFWTYLRKQLVTALLQPAGQPPLTPLECLLRARLPQFEGARSKRGGPSLIDDLRGLFGAAAPLCEQLCTMLRSVPQLTPSLVRAIAMLFIDDEERRRDAGDWLAGHYLTQSQLQGLRLPAVEQTDQGRETESHEVVLGLCRLSSSRTPLVVFYDQMEAFRDQPGDLRGFHKFGQVFSSLRAEPACHLLQVVFARTDTRQDITGSLDHAHRDRLFEKQTSLLPLGWESACQLLTARMNAVPGLQTLRQERLAAGAEALWPLNRGSIDRLHDGMKHRCTPRALLTACRKEFDRTREVGTVDVAVADFLRTQYQRRARDRRARTGPDRLLGVLAGLPLLTRLFDLPHREVPAGAVRRDLPDANLVVESGRHQLWVYGNCAYYSNLWQRFKRWHARWNDHLSRRDRCERLLLVGDRHQDDLPPGTRNHLDGLRRLAGVRYQALSDEAVNGFEALQRLLRDAESGDLDYAGTTLESAAVLDWARASIAEPAHPLGVLRLLADELGFDLTPVAAPPAAVSRQLTT